MSKTPKIENWTWSEPPCWDPPPPSEVEPHAWPAVGKTDDYHHLSDLAWAYHAGQATLVQVLEKAHERGSRPDHLFEIEHFSKCVRRQCQAYDRRSFSQLKANRAETKAAERACLEAGVRREVIEAVRAAARATVE